MKRLFSIVALLMFTVAVTPIAEAKKLVAVSLSVRATKLHQHRNNSNKTPIRSAKIRRQSLQVRKALWVVC